MGQFSGLIAAGQINAQLQGPPQSAALGPLTIGTSVLSAGLNFAIASSALRKRRRAARITIGDLSAMQDQIQFRRLVRTQQISRSLKQGVSTFLNQVAQGISAQETAAQAVGEAAQDTFIVEQTAQQQIDAIQVQKENVSLNSGGISPFAHAITGAVEGLQLGLSLTDTLNKGKAARYFSGLRGMRSQLVLEREIGSYNFSKTIGELINDGIGIRSGTSSFQGSAFVSPSN